MIGAQFLHGERMVHKESKNQSRIFTKNRTVQKISMLHNITTQICEKVTHFKCKLTAKEWF